MGGGEERPTLLDFRFLHFGAHGLVEVCFFGFGELRDGGGVDAVHFFRRFGFFWGKGSVRE